MKLNLGCGSDIREGWTNIDFLPNKARNYIQHDLRKGLPGIIHGVNFVDIIYMSHLNEHLTPEENLHLLRDCHEVIKDNGVLHIELPDFRRTIEAYLNGDHEYFNHPAIKAFAPDGLLGQNLDYALHQRVHGKPEHVTFIDSQIMTMWLNKVGFRDVFLVPFNPHININNELRKRYSLYFEAHKLFAF